MEKIQGITKTLTSNSIWYLQLHYSLMVQLQIMTLYEQQSLFLVHELDSLIWYLMLLTVVCIGIRYIAQSVPPFTLNVS